MKGKIALIGIVLVLLGTVGTFGASAYSENVTVSSGESLTVDNEFTDFSGETYSEISVTVNVSQSGSVVDSETVTVNETEFGDGTNPDPVFVSSEFANLSAGDYTVDVSTDQAETNLNQTFVETTSPTTGGGIVDLEGNNSGLVVLALGVVGVWYARQEDLI